MTTADDRRSFLKLLGLGGVVFASGLPGVGALARAAGPAWKDFFFLQLSDTHWGYSGPANPEAAHTLERTVQAINRSPRQPDFIVFTGDLTHTTDDPGVRRQRMKEFKALVAPLKAKTVRFLPGEHDASLDAGEAFVEHFGPTRWAFDHQGVHFVALDNILWIPPAERAGATKVWKPALDAHQLAWLAEDLKAVPERQPVMLMMHVPLNDMTNRAEVYRLIEHRPFCLSIAGHTHWHEHRFLRREDGWMAPEPHHHIVNVTACGSWWSGLPDELGIPTATMACGAPNGYTVLTFHEGQVKVDFKAARRPASYQMNIFAPETVVSAATGNTPVYVNLFNGAENSVVELRFDNQGPWQKLEKVREQDPMLLAQRAREGTNAVAPWRALPNPILSPHLWKGWMPAHVAPGVHYLCVQGRDVNGTLHPAVRTITVE